MTRQVIRLFLAAALLASAVRVFAHDARSNASGYRAEVAANVAPGSGSVVTLTDNHKAISHFSIRDDYVVLVPEARTALYGDDGRGNAVVARGFDGRIRWQAPIGGVELPRNIIAGGNTVIAEIQVGQWGIQNDHIESWPEIYTSRQYVAIAIDNGCRVWASDEKATGIPFWTNGKIVLTLWLDLRREAVEKVESQGAALPIWLQVRSAANLKLLWQRRLPGWPPIFSRDMSTRVSPATHRLQFTFKRAGDNQQDREDRGADRNPALSHYSVELPLAASISGNATSGQLYRLQDRE